MKKQIYAVLLATSAILSMHAAPTQFAGSLTNLITKSADSWIDNFVSKHDINRQLMFLNLFIPPASSSVEATMKCIQEIQADSTLAPTSAELEKNMQKPIQLYITNMQKKFESLKKNSKADVKEFLEKLEKKIYELIAHFYGIYYTKLYNHIEKQDPSVLLYMFDEQGVIAPAKRTKALPKPTN